MTSMTRDQRIRWMTDGELNLGIDRLLALRSSDRADHNMIDSELECLAAERVARTERRKGSR